MLSSLDILTLIPQRAPFVMVDALLHYDELVTRTKFTILPDNIFVENGKFTEPGLVENIAQTAAARAGYVAQSENKPVLVGYIGAIKNLEIFNLPNINDELTTEVTVVNQIFDVTVINGKTWCNDVLMAQCEMKIFISQSK
ncbi:MAG: 3-hydroxyacyl-ACP dehydratase [Ferruginibacter sp.]